MGSDGRCKLLCQLSDNVMSKSGFLLGDQFWCDFNVRLDKFANNRLVRFDLNDDSSVRFANQFDFHDLNLLRQQLPIIHPLRWAPKCD